MAKTKAIDNINRGNLVLKQVELETNKTLKSRRGNLMMWSVVLVRKTEL